MNVYTLKNCVGDFHLCTKAQVVELRSLMYVV